MKNTASVNFGKFLENIRRECGVSTRDLAEGLCNPSMITKIESGERFSSMLLRDRLIERLGMTSDEYEKFVKNDEYERWKSRRRILSEISNKDYDLAEQEIRLYAKMTAEDKGSGVLEEQFCLDMTAMIAKLRGEKDAAAIAGKALRKTVTVSPEGIAAAPRLSPKEINLIIEYSMGLDKKTRKKQLETVLDSVADSDISARNFVLFYPKLVWAYISDLLDENAKDAKWLADALLMIDRAQKCLWTTGRLFYSLELVDLKEKIWNEVLKIGGHAAADVLQDFTDCREQNEEERILWTQLGEEFSVSMETRDWCYLYNEDGIKNVGDIIKRRRIMIGMSQEKLCQDICSLETLDRIEKNKRDPQPANMMKLFERLGLASEYQKTYLSVVDSSIKYSEEMAIRYANAGLCDEALAELQNLDHMLDHKTAEDKQFISMMRVMIEKRKGHISAEDCSGKLQNILGYTLPHYDVSGEYYMTRIELSCLYNMIMVNAGAVSAELGDFWLKMTEMDREYDSDVRILELLLYAKIMVLKARGNTDDAKKTAELLAVTELNSKRSGLLYLALSEISIIHKLQQEQNGHMGAGDTGKADIRNPLRYLLMNRGCVASAVQNDILCNELKKYKQTNRQIKQYESVAKLKNVNEEPLS